MTTTFYASLPPADAPGPSTGIAERQQRRFAILPEDALANEALRSLRYELDLPEDDRRRRTVERLRAWLTLDTADARRVACAYEGAAAGLEPEEREEVRRAEEDAVMDGVSYLEFQRLAEFVPSLQHLVPEPRVPASREDTFIGSLAAVLAIAGATEL